MGYITFGVLSPFKGRFKSVYLLKYEAQSVLHILNKFKPTRLILPKPALQELLEHERQADFSSVVSVITGGCYIPYGLIAAWKDRLDVPVCSFLGLSE